MGASRKSGFTEEVEFPASRETLGRYELIGVLGEGGMATVHLARVRGPSGFSKLFAIKRIHPMLAKQEQFVDMFLDEARVAAALHHPNIAQVFELGEDGGRYFLAMEYLHGEPLSSILARLHERGERLPIPLACRIVGQVAEALHHAHHAHDHLGRPLHVVHRDVSPQNIFVTYGGSVKLTDFGVAKATSNVVRTDTGAVKGKFAYMAPEQALGYAIDARTDLFALGAVLWECLTGARLFRGATDAETLLKVSRCEVSPPRSLRSEIPEDLEGVVMCLLAEGPSERFDNAAALARALSTFCREVSTGDVAAWIGERFADARARKDALVSEVPAGDAAGDAPTAPTSLPDPAQPTSGVSTRTVPAPAREVAPAAAELHPEPLAEPLAPRPASARPAGRARPIAAIAGALTLALGGGAFALWYTQNSLPAPPRAPEGTAPASAISSPIAGAAGETAPLVEAPITLVEAPTVEAPIVEAPIVEAPVVEAPIVEAPIVEAPAPRAPRARVASHAVPRTAPVVRVSVAITVRGGGSYGHVWIDGRERDVPCVIDLPEGPITFRYRIAEGPVARGRATISARSPTLRLAPP